MATIKVMSAGAVQAMVTAFDAFVPGTPLF
jgi:hypothetical protein